MIKKRKVNPYNIVVSVCGYFCITEKRFFSRSRKRSLAKARQIAMYIMRYYGTVSTYAGIRDFFEFRNSIRNHATIIHSVKVVEAEMVNNRAIKEQVEELCKQLTINIRNYVDIHWFINIEKGKKLHLKYGLDGGKTIIWEHDSIEKRSGRIYIKGRVRVGNEWVENDNMMYEDNGFMCAGDGEKVYATGKEVLV